MSGFAYALPIGVNLVRNVSVSDTPFAPLGLAVGRIDACWTPFASPRAIVNGISQH